MDWKRRILIVNFLNCIQVAFKKSMKRQSEDKDIDQGRLQYISSWQLKNHRSNSLARTVRFELPEYQGGGETPLIRTRPWKQSFHNRTPSFDNFNTDYYYFIVFSHPIYPVHGSCYDTDTRWRLITIVPRTSAAEVLRRVSPSFFRSFAWCMRDHE